MKFVLEAPSCRARQQAAPPTLLHFVLPLFLAVLLLPSAAGALTREEARHLLVRSGFAAEPAEIAAFEPLSRTEAVERLLREAGSEARAPAPPWTVGWRPPRLEDLSSEERRLLRRQNRERGLELKGWWMREMATSPAPLTEVMTLFWHNHFTSSLRKVKAPVLLYRQNVLFRKEALGNFARLLHAVARDPAMLVYLDGARSKKDAPNENFARELFELFTLGEGHFGEADVKDAARAFTGWSLDRQSGAFHLREGWHDGGEKTVLGQRGRFDGEDVIALLLDHPRTAAFVVEKLWRTFVSETPEPAEVQRLARLFREAGYEIKPLLAAIFTSDAFWAAENRGRLIKSPVDLLVGTLRLFDLPVEDYGDLARLSRRLGQDLFDPPNVKGWPGGSDWITTASLLDRQALLARVTGGKARATMQRSAMQDASSTGRAGRARLFDAWVDGLPATWQSAESVSLLLLAVPAVDVEVLDLRASGAQVRQLLSDPAYQVK